MTKLVRLFTHKSVIFNLRIPKQLKQENNVAKIIKEKDKLQEKKPVMFKEPNKLFLCVCESERDFFRIHLTGYF